MPPLFFTIACANYISKANVLAASVKRAMPDATIVLVLPERHHPSSGRPCLFDQVILAKDIGIPDLDPFVFRHFVAEAATAIKARCFKHLLATTDRKQVIYLDPDIEVFGPFEELFDVLRRGSVVLTPHLLAPEEEHDARAGTVLSRLKYGLFNLGFIAVSDTPETRRFLDWWDERLLNACYFNHDEGHFFDQRWIDLASTLFDVTILRHPGYNLAYWNISGRRLSQTGGSLRVNGEPLRFVHFSGTGPGYDLAALEKHNAASGGLPLQLRSDYLAKVNEAADPECRDEPWSYSTYRSGEAISPSARLAYRGSLQLRARIPQPFEASNAEILTMQDSLRLTG